MAEKVNFLKLLIYLVKSLHKKKLLHSLRTRLGLDDALAAAGGLRNEPVELIGDNSPLNDHVDSELDGGEDESGVPTQQNLQARGKKHKCNYRFIDSSKRDEKNGC